tara:strand:- start:78 stop:674 length:597 start_codon:yes stop_codon:yes gene_type:complete
MINFYKKFPLQIIFVVLFSILIVQNIPIFEREEPFFIYPDGVEELYKHDALYSLGIIEPITDRLNRTLPWKMFASGYEPSITSLIFGHGPASYLNIVKNSETVITSGPHSSLLLILNKFGIFGLLLSAYSILMLLLSRIFNIDTKIRIIIFIFASILFSLEIKTDSLMLTDGFIIFLFNLLNISLLFRFNDKTSHSSY